MAQVSVCRTCGYAHTRDSSEGMCPKCLLSLALDTRDEVFLIGEVVSHYRITEKVGGGGMGIVFKAEDTRLGRPVALKFLPERFIQDRQALERFRREARVASSLNHPHICTVYDVGEYQGRPFIVMELLEGQALKHVASTGPLSPDRIIQIATHVADGLAAAHGLGIVHRDIKPANLFVTNRGDIKIVDFGLAREKVAAPEDAPETQVTSQGLLLGTIPYMSPEQLEGRPVDHRTDLFSLGTVLHELATGSPPFARASSTATLNAIVHEQPPSVRKLQPHFPRGLCDVIEQLLAKNPDQRYQSANDLLSALEKLQPLPPSPSWLSLLRTWKGAKWIVAAFALLLAFLLTAIVFDGWWQRQTQIDSVAVLPFENLSGDENLEFIADGMTEALNISLARIEELRVPSRTSVMRFKGQDRPISRIARELKVDAIVEGSIQSSGENLFVRFSLVEADTDEILRSGDYQVDQADFVKIQNEIARAIAEEIRGELSPEAEARMRSLHPADPAAYESFMRGLYLLNERASLDRAVEYLRQAAEGEPENALVHAYLADALLLSASTGYGAVSPVEVVPRAKEEALRALEIDRTLPEAHAAFAMASFSYDWDYNLAEKHFQLAVEGNPEYATAYHWYGLLLAARGELDKALEQVQKARDLEPYSPLISAAMARIYYYRREYPQAERYYRDAIDLEGDFVPAWLGLGLLQLVEGRLPDALDSFREALPPETHELLTSFAAGLQSPSGPEMLRQLTCAPGSEAHCGFYLAVAACIVGQTDEAFDRLQQAWQAKSEYLVYMKVDPIFDPIRHDSRYPELLASLKLEGE